MKNDDANFNEKAKGPTVVFETIKKILIFFFLFILVINTVYIVSAGTRGILLTFGKVSMTPQEEGLHFKIPFVQTVVMMNVQTQKYEAEADSASKDLQIVSADIATNFRIDSSKAPQIYRELGVNYIDNIIQPAEQEAVKAITARFTAEELITKREEVRLEIGDLLKSKLLPRGIIVEDISITNFDFSKSFNEAIESKVTAEQLKLKAERDLERIRVEAEQIAVQAEGKKRAQIEEAQGQAEAIRLLQEELEDSPHYIELLTVQKWDGVLPKVTGGATPFISID
jgi:regulator of protease activity HflC (stomatin/prohibitin superfamily)